MSGSTGAQLLMKALARRGVRRIFTLSGNQILPLYDASLDERIALVDTRHENAAVHMADAWARLTGEVGVCLVSGGPGHTNTLTGLAVAQAAESRVLVIAGAPDTRQLGLGAFQELDQTAISRPLCKGVFRPLEAASLDAEVDAAFRLASQGRPGPVVLLLPGDVLAQEALAGAGRDALEDVEPTVSGVDGLVELLSRAQRPVALVGPASARHGCGRSLEALCAATALPALVVASPRGLNDASLRGAGALVREADVVVLVGKRPDFTVGFARPPAIGEAAQVVQIDAAPPEPDLRRGHLVIRGSPESVLTRLSVALGRKEVTFAAWAAKVRACQEEFVRGWPAIRSGPGAVHPLDLCRAVEAVLRPDDVLVTDGGEFCQWPQSYFHDRRPIIPGPLGAVGCSVAFGLGAQLARPQARVFAFTGDGGFGFHGLELDTAARHKLPVVTIIGNDAAWTTERYKQVHRYGKARVVATELARSPYEQLAVALGGHGEAVREAGDLAAALQRCLASGLPACLNVHIEPALGPSTRPQ